jgi:hypothetical protein
LGSILNWALKYLHSELQSNLGFREVAMSKFFKYLGFFIKYNGSRMFTFETMPKIGGVK